MANKFITVPPGMLESLFPFHFAIDKNGVVVSAGASIVQRCADINGQGLIGSHIDALFYCVNPKIDWSHAEIRKRINSLFLLEHKQHPCRMRGQFVYIPDDDVMLFLGSPWLTNTRQLEELCFTFDSFALHDATLDMLHAHQASLNAIADAHLLEEKLRRKNLVLQDRSVELFGIMNALDHFQDAVLIFDKHDCNISYANMSACQLANAIKYNVIGSSFKAFIGKLLEDQHKLELDAWIGDCFASPSLPHIDSDDYTPEVWQSRVSIKKDTIRESVYDVTLQTVGHPKAAMSVIATFRDVTEQVISGRANRRGERLESLGKLSGGIAHDLNNALAPITLSIGSLRRLYPNSPDILQLMDTSVKRAADMVRQLLTFAKGIEGERAPIDIQSLIGEIHQLVKGTFPKNISFDVDCPANLPSFLGDATQIHQVLLNLCVNARDAMQGGGVISVKVYKNKIDDAYAAQIRDVEKVKAGHYLAIQVRDTGTGIAPEVLDKIFDPFFTTKSPDKGTGLGLSTVMGIVKSHGGFTEVDSMPGKGATFTIYFPTNGNEQTLMDTAVYEQLKFFGKGETVLVVDDEHTIRETTCMLLRQFNLMPIAAEDGADGMAKVSGHRDQLRLIITDMHMPNMDGLQLTISARRLIPKIPIVVCSGRMEDHVEQKISQMDGVHRLNKPFHEFELLEVIKQALAPIQSEAF